VGPKATGGAFVGRCIYCGSTESLTREHVLPRGLGGGEPPAGYDDALVLAKATCESCRRITAAVEDKCLNQMLGPGRQRLGLKRKDRQGPTAVASIVLADGRKETRVVPVEAIPGAILIPSFREATAFREIGPPASYPGPDIEMRVTVPGRTSLIPDAAKVGVSLQIEPIAFARMLAKIALGIAVAKLGPNAFEPVVQPLILGHDHRYWHWVGGFAGQNHRVEKTTSLHTVRLTSRNTLRGTFVVVHIYLFSEFAVPGNYVVVGTFSPLTMEREQRPLVVARAQR
jgi:hypothetical protein